MSNVGSGSGVQPQLACSSLLLLILKLVASLDCYVVPHSPLDALSSVGLRRYMREEQVIFDTSALKRCKGLNLKYLLTGTTCGKKTLRYVS
eukprot:scaffold8712_cov135-Skeletonema_dohrnii-CCMP3373.AAC.2